MNKNVAMISCAVILLAASHSAVAQGSAQGYADGNPPVEGFTDHDIVVTGKAPWQARYDPDAWGGAEMHLQHEEGPLVEIKIWERALESVRIDGSLQNGRPWMSDWNEKFVTINDLRYKVNGWEPCSNKESCKSYRPLDLYWIRATAAVPYRDHWTIDVQISDASREKGLELLKEALTLVSPKFATEQDYFRAKRREDMENRVRKD